MNIGKNIYNLRRDRNITQEALAAELGVTAAAVSKWENGYTLPDILMLCALADYFEVTTDELLGRKQEWRYAVIAAETSALGSRIEALARHYGIKAKGIYTDFQEADKAAGNDDTVRYLIAGFHTGFYGSSSHRSTLVCVHPTDDEILDAFNIVFHEYLDDSTPQFILN